MHLTKRNKQQAKSLPLVGEPCLGGVVPFTCTKPDATLALLEFFTLLSDWLSRYAGTAACNAGVLALTDSVLELLILVVEW